MDSVDGVYIIGIGIGDSHALSYVCTQYIAKKNLNILQTGPVGSGRI